jgi:hypothetical protein
MPETIVAVRLTSLGAPKTRADLESVRAAMLGVDRATVQNARDTRDLSRDARLLNNQSRMQTQIFLAQYPVLNNLSRAMSGFAAVTRGALVIVNAINLANLAFNSTNATLFELQARARELERELKLTTDPEKVRDLNDELGITNERIKEINQQTTQTNFNNWIIGITGVTFAAQTAVKAIISVASFFVAGSAFSVALGAGIILFAAIAAVVGAIALAFYLALTLGDQFQQFVNAFFPEMAGWVEYTGKIIDDVFVVSIPNAFISFINFWGKGLEHWINMNVSAVNLIIRAINSIAKAVGLPQISLIPKWNFTEFGMMESRNWGAGGPGTYSGMKKPGTAGLHLSDNISASVSRGTGGSIIINNNITGGLIAQKEVEAASLEALKQALKRNGFAG